MLRKMYSSHSGNLSFRSMNPKPGTKTNHVFIIMYCLHILLPTRQQKKFKMFFYEISLKRLPLVKSGRKGRVKIL